MVTRVNGSTYELKNVEGSHEVYQLLTMATPDRDSGTTDSELIDVLIDRVNYKSKFFSDEKKQAILESLEAIKYELSAPDTESEAEDSEDPELDGEE